MIISFVAAMDQNRVIGKDNALPWNMPADMQHFREVTRGKPVIMGRKTFQSIGHPLPDRLNIVMTRDAAYRPTGCAIAHSVKEALDAAAGHEEVMVIGGAQIFEEFLPLAQRMYLTYIDGIFPGDVRFPALSEDAWRVCEREEHAPDARNPHAYAFVRLERMHQG